ncbi:twitching motility protein PilT [Rhodopirellula maiorica SM1]|uniref:Twitching motility protein PilT n=2 Tax=Novipirellula TaxID=2795426 RepID=M5RDV8_9BACT|nr:twitching motility protein PilT [Rhodopirellula maiorica SM1]
MARLKSTLLQEKKELEVDKIFRALVKLEGSDLHLKTGQPPMVRVRGELKPLNRPPIENEEMVDLLMPMMDDRNLLIFEQEGGADFSYQCEVDGVRWRFRINMLKALGSSRFGGAANQQLDSRLQRPVSTRIG